MAVVGVDGCKGGWFAVRIAGGDWDVRVFEDVESLWSEWRAADLILIDTPIGLPDKRRPIRTCDVRARELLGRSRGSSVFPAPGRAAFGQDSYSAGEDPYEADSLANQAETGKKLTKQTWNIIPKISEVDRLLRSCEEARSKVREAHPEVCFWAFNGEKAVASRKRTREGRLARLEILRRLEPRSDAILHRAMTSHPRKDLAEDDVLDALVLAITATRQPNGLATIPTAPEYDACGLPMEMVYARPQGSSHPTKRQHGRQR